MRDQKIEFAKKLLALSRQGIGGEKDNAEKFLQRIMKQYEITFEELEGDQVFNFKYSYKTKLHGKFFNQIIASVNNDIDRWKDATNKIYYFECTRFEQVQIMERQRFYWKIYTDELDVFYSAFIQAQKLYRTEKSDRDDNEEEPEQTPEERAYNAYFTNGLRY